MDQIFSATRASLVSADPPHPSAYLDQAQYKKLRCYTTLPRMTGSFLRGAGAATVPTCITVTYGVRLRICYQVLRNRRYYSVLYTSAFSRRKVFQHLYHNHVSFGLEPSSFPFKLTSTPQCTGHLLHHRCSDWMIRGFGGLTGWWQHYVTPTGDF